MSPNSRKNSKKTDRVSSGIDGDAAGRARAFIAFIRSMLYEEKYGPDIAIGIFFICLVLAIKMIRMDAWNIFLLWVEGATPFVVEAGMRALGGGLAGASAMVIQVASLMWMRTIMNYQYRYGTSTTETMRTLYREGGIRRFYRGITPALLQGPVSRFGDTAANAGFLALMDSLGSTRYLPAAVKTIGASMAAGSWRIFLTPIDTVKTILQVEGKEGLDLLFAKARVNGPSVYYHGAMAAAAATFVGHYPWFATFNTLQANIPVPDDQFQKLARNALIGLFSSVISDCISNSLRVVKTYRQTNPEDISYADTIRKVVEKDGYMGLFGRGLRTRILANGLQGLMFSVLWKYFDEKLRAQGA